MNYYLHFFLQMEKQRLRDIQCDLLKMNGKIEVRGSDNRETVE